MLSRDMNYHDHGHLPATKLLSLVTIIWSIFIRVDDDSYRACSGLRMVSTMFKMKVKQSEIHIIVDHD